MGKKIICYIQAYDCKKTIEAAMQSVLDQTYENWTCFVLSNGNSVADNDSFEVIKQFAARDRRFVLLNKEYNNVNAYIPMLFQLAKKFPDSYVCSLDADDTYKNDFFNRALSLAEKYRLDIVACGTEIVLKKRAGVKQETLLSKREIGEDLIIKEEDFTNKFSIYKPFFNEMWGKLYAASLFGKEYDRRYAQKNYFNHFLPDTLFTVDNLSRSTAIGILSGTAHKFYQFEQRSATNATVMSNLIAANGKKAGKFFFRNHFSVYDTYETLLSFLRTHGEVDYNLYEYMQAVLFGWFNDFYSRTLLLTTSEAMLAKHVSNLVFHAKFDELMCYQDSGKYNNLKNFEKRIDFCELLRNMLICQEVLQNRGRIKNNRGKIHLNCTAATKRKLNQIVAKLDSTLQVLWQLQKKEEQTCCKTI